MVLWKRRTTVVSPVEVDEAVSKEQHHANGAPAQVHLEKELHRGLKARHITMIAIGGAIGTGLIIGTGKALAAAG
jgi:amino acid transporter